MQLCPEVENAEHARGSARWSLKGFAAAPPSLREAPIVRRERLAQFVQRSRDSLANVEAGLLALRSGADAGVVDSVLCPIRSISGVAGILGFGRLGALASLCESLLRQVRVHQIRGGAREPPQDAVAALLQAVECLRFMVEAIESSGEDFAFDDIDAAMRWLAATPTGWSLRYRPRRDQAFAGRDPLRVFSHLAALGELAVRVELDDLPSLAELDPEKCYLAWRLELVTAAPESWIREAFACTAGDSELSIEERRMGAAPPACAARAVAAELSEGIWHDNPGGLRGPHAWPREDEDGRNSRRG